MLTDSLVEISPAGAGVEGGYERGVLSLEHEVVVPGLARAPARHAHQPHHARQAAPASAAYRLQRLLLHQRQQVAGHLAYTFYYTTILL